MSEKRCGRMAINPSFFLVSLYNSLDQMFITCIILDVEGQSIFESSSRDVSADIRCKAVSEVM